MVSRSNLEWRTSMLSGGKPTWLATSPSVSGVYSSDGRNFISILNHQIRVYFISTRQCIRTIDVDVEGIVDVKLDPSNDSQVLVFKEKSVAVINWKERLNNPIIATILMTDDSNVEDILSAPKVTKDSIFTINGKTTKHSKPSTKKVFHFNKSTQVYTKLCEISNVMKFSVSIDKTKFVFLKNDNELTVIDLSSVYELENQIGEDFDYTVPQSTLTFVYKSPIVSMAISNNSMIALGSLSGPIQVLFGGNVDQKLMKWHIGPVKSLCFTNDNNYLISGGQEKVLVFWQIDSDKTQFLPRLNGSIEKICIDTNKLDYYNLMLKLNDDDEDNHELLVISGVDLVSRLSINTIRPQFHNLINPTLYKSRKKYLKSKDKNSFDITKLKYDYTSNFEINPKSNHLYFPNKLNVQCYDLIRNEQVFLQSVASSVSIGKVRSETKLNDPLIMNLKFTHDGEWMCTFDILENSDIDDLLSKDLKQYALKFWKYVEPSNQGKLQEGYWELTTKVIDPHGNGSPILSITPAPYSYNQGLAFVTADANGNVRIWKPRTPKDLYSKQKSSVNGKLQQTAWTVSKVRNLDIFESKAVDTCWSNDGSMIVLTHESSIKLLNGSNLSDIYNDRLALSESNIRAVDLIEHNLIILSKRRVSSFNLLTNKVNELVAEVNLPLGGKNLMAVDPSKNLFALGVNYYNTHNDKFEINSKVIIFSPHEVSPRYIHHHDHGISSINCFNSSFLFIDFNSRIGCISNSDIVYNKEPESIDENIQKMLMNAQATANIINNKSVDTAVDNDNGSVTKSIDLNNFQTIFENDSIPLDNLFERIIKIIK